MTEPCTRIHQTTSKFAPVPVRLEPIMCAHFGENVGVLFIDPQSESGYSVVSYRDGKPGLCAQTIWEPLAEQFTEWCESWVLER